MSYQLPQWSWTIFYVELSLTLAATSRTENVLAPVSESRPKPEINLLGQSMSSGAVGFGQTKRVRKPDLA